MNVDRYLSRIGYQGRRETVADVLRRLQYHHLFTVPFENLDVGRRPIVIDEDAFVRKVVDERRGGFCYELNGAFAALLRALGFGVTLLSAGVARKEGGFGPDFDHLALLVDAGTEQWLADVGFGDSFLHPLRFLPDMDQNDPAGVFRIERDGDAFVVRRGREPQYRFLLQPHSLDEYSGMCHYHQTSPQSHFTQNTICSRITDAGRITLSGRKLITTTRDGARTERDLTDSQWIETLRDQFGITLPRVA